MFRVKLRLSSKNQRNTFIVSNRAAVKNICPSRSQNLCLRYLHALQREKTVSHNLTVHIYPTCIISHHNDHVARA